MYEAYIELHHLNIAHSVEIWNSENKLVGGLYGVDTGKIFSGESMFSTERDTSKMAFIALANITQQRGYTLIDCQLENPHLFSMGAENISRSDYMKALRSTTLLTINSLPVDNWKIELDCVKLSYWQPNVE
jgi:leucyl/phenylalanyl-tRNA--protein transferase